MLARQAAVRRIVRRRAALGGPSAERPGAGLPAYVRAIAAEAGADVEHTRWALAAPGDYPSQKVLFFLFGSTGEVPDAIVKITRDPELNYRLENEWRALTILRELGVGTDDTLPRPLFLGSHSGLAVLGESAIDGAPFRERTRATADCVHARAAVEWLLELGTATVSRPGADARGPSPSSMRSSPSSSGSTGSKRSTRIYWTRTRPPSCAAPKGSRSSSSTEIPGRGTS